MEKIHNQDKRPLSHSPASSPQRRKIISDISQGIVGNRMLEGVKVIPGNPYDEIKLIGADESDLWQRDVYKTMNDFMKDPAFRAELSIRSDNPVATIGLPILPVGHHDEVLWVRVERAKEQLDPKSPEYAQFMVRREEFFGMDQLCQDWVPHCNLPLNTGNIEIVRQEAPVDFKSVIPSAARFVLSSGLVYELWSSCCARFYNPVKALFYPLRYAERQDILASMTARIRHDIIWPLFHSTEAFWTLLEARFNRDRMENAYVWPDGVRGMSIAEIRDVLDPNNEDEYIKLSYALEAIVGSYPRYSHRFNEFVESGKFPSPWYCEDDECTVRVQPHHHEEVANDEWH